MRSLTLVIYYIFYSIYFIFIRPSDVLYFIYKMYQKITILWKLRNDISLLRKLLLCFFLQ